MRRKVNVENHLFEETKLESLIDYSLLDPTAGVSDVEKACNIAHKHKYHAVCVCPVNVKHARDYIDFKLKSPVLVCAVVAFPLGESLTETKVFEAKRCFADGADEIDFVASMSRARSGDWAYVKNDISRVVRISKRHIVKVVIETAYFKKTEIEHFCKICARCKVDYVMTSSGFAGGGATPEIVEIMVNALSKKCNVKASGGVATRLDAINLARMGATRIGTSREI